MLGAPVCTEAAVLLSSLLQSHLSLLVDHVAVVDVLVCPKAALVSKGVTCLRLRADVFFCHFYPFANPLLKRLFFTEYV